MRVNRYVALATGLSRRAADTVIAEGRVYVNGVMPTPGQDVGQNDTVTFNGQTIQAPSETQTILLNKPVGYVVSRDGQGSKTVYDLLPPELHHVKPVGRLDKDSSGLLLMTTDGQLAQKLTHPSYQKEKIYEITLDKPLSPQDIAAVQNGVMLEDGISKLHITHQANKSYTVRMHEGRNRQIRRTFATIGYNVAKLHRTHFGDYTLAAQLGGYIVL
ncbi:MAG TPA: pseudouridine synthase [Candidatus Saccharimonadales bacterium]|nr:pseudouridine synthase [Candidatus Saccharimonadales bacterium]